MPTSLPLRILGCLASIWLASGAVAQDTNSADSDPSETMAEDLPVGSAEQWLKNILQLAVEENANNVLNRLGSFYLSPSQVRRLIKAAEEEEASYRRVVLWHAIRMSQDIQGRDYLIQSLVARSDAATQIQFLDSFRNPTRFDVPILVALYHRHRPTQNAAIDNANPPAQDRPPKKQSTSQLQKADPSSAWPSRPESPNGVSKNDRRSGRNPQAQGADPTLEMGERAPDSKQTGDAHEEEEPHDRDHDSTSPIDYGDAMDVAQKIVDMTCQCQWNQALFDSSGSLYRDDEYASQESKGKRGVLGRAQGNEAQRAQREMLHWLIKYGFEDQHRIIAFEQFARTFGQYESTTIGAEYGRDLLKGLNNPESRARVVRLLEPWVEPASFLAPSEGEVVRLAAIETMLRLLISCRKAPTISNYQDIAALYTPVLSRTIENDPAPQVKSAAQRLLATIREYDQLDAKEAKGQLK